MLIRSRARSAASEGEVTPRSVWLNRRALLASGSAAAGVALAPTLSSAVSYPDVRAPAAPAWLAPGLAGAKPAVVTTDEDVTPWEYASSYNNFYEFGTDKGDPLKHAGDLKIDPWSIRIDGEVENPGSFYLEDLIKPHQLEERIYRLRCVEAWSMVIPWLGVPLRALLERAAPKSGARYVRFETLVDPEQMPGQRSWFSGIDWPYVEGLRLDEAMHPLTLMAVGMYGEMIPNQNGAPVRLVVPWKYGFKSIKSIVRISLRRRPPQTTWQQLQPSEYGFYANVNPQVDHPRWSQAMERRLPSSLFAPNRIPTQMFNGYAEEVGELYAGMDLRRNY